MDIQFITLNGSAIAMVESNHVIIHNAQDALDLLANCNYQGAAKIIIKVENLHADFFDLKTGLAGEVLQKFSNYRTQLAIVGDFSVYTSKRLRDFIIESNKAGNIYFVGNTAEAQQKLSV